MKNGLLKAWREYRGFAVFVVLMVIFRSALADWNVVPTGSMKPTIVEGDRILVNKLAYDFKVPLTHISLHKFADPGRGDIVVFDSRAADTRLVKRVIGLPGDVVEMRDNRLIINGIAARYSGIEYAADATFAIESYLDMSHRIELALERAVSARSAPSRSRKTVIWCWATIGTIAPIRGSTGSFRATRSLGTQRRSCSRSTMTTITFPERTGSSTPCES